MKTKMKMGATLALVAVLGGVLTACSPTDDTQAGAAATTTACASAAPAGPPPGAGAPQGGAPAMTLATTIAPTDTSTSVVLDDSGPQIQCGTTPLALHSDVVYDTPTAGGGPLPLKLDVQVPQTAGKKPLVVYLTGGGFVSAVKTANLDQRTYVAEQGYVVASIEYRTATNGATYTDAVADVKSAIRYLRAHAAEYDIDPAEVAVWGQSAGGYLAAMTGVTNGLAAFEGTGNPGQDSTVQAVVDQFGASDISKLAADFDEAAQKADYAPGNALAQFVFGPGTKLSIVDDPAKTTAADPVTYVTANTPPFALLHGTADQVVSPSQTLALHNALRAKGVDSTRYVVQGGNHGDLSFLPGVAKASNQWSSEQVVGDIAGFLGKQLG